MYLLWPSCWSGIQPVLPRYPGLEVLVVSYFSCKDRIFKQFAVMTKLTLFACNKSDNFFLFLSCNTQSKNLCFTVCCRAVKIGPACLLAGDRKTHKPVYFVS